MIRNQYILGGSYHKKFVIDFQECLNTLNIEDKIQFIESLITFTKLQVNFYKTKKEEVTEEISNFYKEHFLKHFGKKINHIVLKLDFFSYFDPYFVFVHKKLVTLEHLNREMDPQGFTDEEFIIVLKHNLRIFQTRLEFLYLERNPEPSESDLNTSTIGISKNVQEKIPWSGTQKELAEVFVEFSRKGFTPELVSPHLIQQTFENSNTIDQILKPGYDEHAKRNEFNQIYTPRYKPRFDTIKHTNSKKK